MKHPKNDFNNLATQEAKKGHAPFSLRLSFDERGILEHDAAGMALGAYIRERLFGEDVTPRTTRGKFPVKDHAALGRVLGNNLNQLARAVNSGSLPVTPETEEELRRACAAVLAMREDILCALGRDPDRAPKP